MLQMTQSNMDAQFNKVISLKNKIIEKHNSETSKSEMINLLKEMRIYHGYAIYNDEVDKIAVLKKDIENLTDDDFIKLSVNASQLYVIHSHIRYCEKIVHNPNNIFQSNATASNIISSDPDDNMDIFKKNTVQLGGQEPSKLSAVIRTNNSNATDEISIKGLETDSEVIQTEENFTVPQFDKINKANNANKTTAKHIQTEDISEYIDNMTSSEFKRLNSENNKNTDQTPLANSSQTNLDVTKPTLINYWADWCGPSKRFKENWDKFKSIASQKFPGLQVNELNVKQDRSLVDLATKIGVKGYPTLVLFKNGQKYYKQAGNLSVADIEKFINEH